MTGDSSTDNRILAPGVARTWEHTGDGITEQATFFLGDDTLTVPLSFAAAQKIADAIDRARREGYLSGISAAGRAVDQLYRNSL